MIMDYNPSNRKYFLRVSREGDEVSVPVLMREHGLDLSSTASSAEEAILFTSEPFAAVTFYRFGTPAAQQALAGIYAQIEASWKKSSDRHFDIPSDKELWPFQGANIEYALPRRHTLIGDEPGLGKTPTAIVFCNEIQADRVLVICPANIRLQWFNRIQEWSTRHLYGQRIIYPILRGKSGTHPNAHWTIVSYDLARTLEIGGELAKGKYDVIVLDEPHYLKERSSKRTQAVFGGGRHPLFEPLAERAERILGLTGTPLPNRPREAYTLARGMCWDAIDWMSEENFQTRFNPSMKRDFVNPETGEKKIYVDERSGRHYELQNRLRASFMSRHLKHGPDGVMEQLKMPIYDLIQVEETGAVKQALEAESLLQIDPEELEGADADVLGHIAVVRRLMGIAMAPQVADYIDMLVESGEDKIVLFAWHIEVMNILEERLRKHGVVRIDGSTSAVRKQKNVERFIKEPELHICLGNVLSMGTGTDGLQQVCNHGLIAEPDWVPGNNIQCFDRLDRGGQNWQVQGDIFVAPNSLAEKVLASALRKGLTIHKTLDHRI
jgi:SWI/SNF-related matrix-associated actin-dependent regulator 1 of chromatin subfamily A